MKDADSIARRFTPPWWLPPPLREWWARRQARRLLDERVAAWLALSPEEHVGLIHPASPQKPLGWSLERYKETQRRRDGAN